MFKKLVKWGFILSLLLFLVIIIAPSFINWNSHKNLLLTQITRYVKDDVEVIVSGDVDFKLLPRPALSLNDVDIVKKQENEAIAHLDSISTMIKLKPLLEGRVEFHSLELKSPVLKFKVNQVGDVNNINIFKKSSTENLSNSAHLIQLNKINVSDASIVYENPYKKFSYSIDEINVDIFADSLAGPYFVRGGAVYNKAELDVDIKTGAYQEDTPVTFNLKAEPKDKGSFFPTIKYSGVLGVDKDLYSQGEIVIEGGKIYSLLIGDNLKNIAFLHEEVNFKSLFEINNEGAKFNAIQCKSKRNESFKGTVEVDFKKKDYSSVSASLDVNNFTITNRILKNYIYPPKTFRGVVDIKGNNIVYAGENIKSAKAKIEFSPNLWDIKVSDMKMKGDTALKVSTRLAPTGDSVYNISLDNKGDFKRFVKSLPLDRNNIFNKLTENSLFDKVNIKTKLILNNGEIQLNDLTGNVGGLNINTANISIDRTVERSNLHAILRLKDVDLDKFKAEDKLPSLIKLLANEKVKLNLIADNVTKNSAKLKKLLLKAESNNGNVEVEKLSAVIGDNQLLDMTGKVDGFNSAIANFDMMVAARTNKPEKVAKFFGVKVPMLNALKYSSNINGKVSGSVNKAEFDLKGKLAKGEIYIKGVSTNKGNNYTSDVKIISESDVDKLLSSLSIPAKSIISKKGKLDLSAKVKGDNNKYSISDIKGKISDVAFVGSVDKGNKTKANITLDYLNIDNFIKSDLGKHLGKDVEIDLKTNKNSWGGVFAANIKSVDINSALIKGSLKDTDLNSIIRASDIPNNLYISKGDVLFNLKKTPKKINGDVTINSKNLEIPQLNYNEIGMLLNAYNEVPKDLKKRIITELKKGKIMFGGVSLKAEIDGDNIALKEPLKHVASFGNIEIAEAGADLHNKDYKTVVKFDIVKPKRIPKFKIEYSKGKTNIVGLEDLKTFIEKNNPPPLQMFTEVNAAPTAVEAADPTLEIEPVKPLDPTPTPESQAIGGILDRLDE